MRRDLIGQGIQAAQVFLPAQPGGQPFYGLRLGQVGTEAQAVSQADGLQLRPALLLGKLPGPYDDRLISMVSSQTRHYVEGFDELMQQVVELDAPLTIGSYTSASPSPRRCARVGQPLSTSQPCRA